jgi:ABC-type antimicrobial peptide transport system permease subunit
VVVALGALAGVASAIMPARRAANLNVLRSVVTE